MTPTPGDSASRTKLVTKRDVELFTTHTPAWVPLNPPWVRTVQGLAGHPVPSLCSEQSATTEYPGRGLAQGDDCPAIGHDTG